MRVHLCVHVQMGGNLVLTLSLFFYTCLIVLVVTKPFCVMNQMGFLRLADKVFPKVTGSNTAHFIYSRSSFAIMKGVHALHAAYT